MRLIDPLKDLQAHQEETGKPAAKDFLPPIKKPSLKEALQSSTDKQEPAPLSAEERIKKDFRLFLVLVWRHLGLPDPTPAQLAIAQYLQHGPQRKIIMAFRGAAKSWITYAYCIWVLYCDPQKQILLVSGAQKLAIAGTQFCLSLIRDMPLLRHLAPTPHQRQSALAFDVGPATPKPSPSFHASGIGGQIVGFRADEIIGDDVETQTNSLTVTMREKVSEGVKEFDSILKPGGRVTFLGTPHDVDSLYPKLYSKRGYSCFVLPVIFPSQEEMRVYGDRLAPYIVDKLQKNPKLVGTSVEPTRFSMDDLTKRRMSLGNSEFALQFLLDTSQTDADRFPLKLRDLIVMSLDPKRGPEALVWTNDPAYRMAYLPVMGFEGDYYYRPIPFGEDGKAVTYSPYSRTVGFIDPSGMGKDEMSMVIGGELNGRVFVLKVYATTNGYGEETLRTIARLCVTYGISELHCEWNYGGGMFAALLKPYITEAWRKHNAALKKSNPRAEEGGTALVDVKSSNKAFKEQRIVQVLEPVTQQHRLVIAEELVQSDYDDLKKLEGEDTRHVYSLFYQYCHLTRERQSLVHDDRLEALAGLCAAFGEQIGVNPEGIFLSKEEERREEELQALFDDADDVSGYPVRTPSNDNNRYVAKAAQPARR